ncbi:helix-turn-helix domain-containing protein [Bartonella krasnovii]|uniref:Helix-turn-helix domain-containing protein n=2 Tax=Bartonella TaxID=773 RepID=A0A5B9D1J5_9HYPH|nr:helix-turn-helix transcriptional regulator [Bartonella krasnovii]QEE12302.1 helix-turn-helix domain-containing protein [Bartonella krasnovii]UNF37836.1 helix-turn-helix domain-containing protein [Bartonella krasnovii]UNF49358.1 helix-turn-helix domain-containing protein [Bartonella krasnovii]UNF53000.1 helix-turn-helix domain-containing protein [Bartonella krasnovii]
MNKIEAKELRKRLNLTQDEMAALLGVNKSTVWRWEKYGVPSRGAVAYLLKSLCEQASPPITKICKRSGVDSACDGLQP